MFCTVGAYLDILLQTELISTEKKPQFPRKEGSYEHVGLFIQAY